MSHLVRLNRKVNLLLSSALVLILLGCAPAPAPKPTTPANTAVPPTATSLPKPASSAPLRLIASGSSDFSSLDVIYWQDLLKKQGFNVDFKPVDAPDTAARSIIAGTADAYVGSLPSAILAVKNANANIKIIAVNNQASDYVVLAKPEIVSIQDLKGKSIGIATPGSAGDIIVRTALKIKGVDPTAARFVTIGGTSARVTAVLAGQVDAAPVHAADAGDAVATGKVKVLFNTGDTIGVYLQSGLIASGDWLKNNPQVAQQVVDAFVDASRWAATNKDGYIALSKDQAPKMDDNVRSSAYDLYIQGKFWPVNGGLGQAGVDAFLKLSQDSGDLPKDLPPQSQWLDDSFVKNYVSRHPVMTGN
jgi:NitT/TauT family transport system substrate-binding protein